MKSHSVYDLVFGKAKLVSETPDDLRRVAEDPTRFHIVSFQARPGALWFLTKLEHDYFPPGTAKNDELHLRYVNWPSKGGHPWMVISIPIEKRPLAEEVADHLDMKLANGVPRMFIVDPKNPWLIGVGSARPDRKDLDFVDVFPMDNDRVWTLENRIQSEFHKSPEGVAKMAERERVAVEAIFENFKLRN